MYSVRNSSAKRKNSITKRQGGVTSKLHISTTVEAFRCETAIALLSLGHQCTAKRASRLPSLKRVIIARPVNCGWEENSSQRSPSAYRLQSPEASDLLLAA